MTDPTAIVRQGMDRVKLEPLTLSRFHARRERRRRNERLAAGAVGGVIVIVMAIVTVRSLSGSSIDVGGLPTPTLAPVQTVEFRSELHGFSFTHPESWQTTIAMTERVRGLHGLAYWDRVLDAVGHPLLDGGSVPIPDGMTSAEWLEREGRFAAQLAGLDGSAFASRPTTVDGVPAQLSETCNVVLVVKDRRGYVFQFHVSLATNTELRDVVRSIELHPEDAAT